MSRTQNALHFHIMLALEWGQWSYLLTNGLIVLPCNWSFDHKFPYLWKWSLFSSLQVTINAYVHCFTKLWNNLLQDWYTRMNKLMVISATMYFMNHLLVVYVKFKLNPTISLKVVLFPSISGLTCHSMALHDQHFRQCHLYRIWYTNLWKVLLLLFYTPQQHFHCLSELLINRGKCGKLEENSV